MSDAVVAGFAIAAPRIWRIGSDAITKRCGFTRELSLRKISAGSRSRGMALQKMLEAEPELCRMRQVTARSRRHNVFLDQRTDALRAIRQRQQIRAELRGNDLGHMSRLGDRIDLFFRQRAECDAVFDTQQDILPLEISKL
jgi:hypothetical protein